MERGQNKVLVFPHTAIVMKSCASLFKNSEKVSNVLQIMAAIKPKQYQNGKPGSSCSELTKSHQWVTRMSPFRFGWYLDYR